MDFLTIRLGDLGTIAIALGMILVIARFILHSDIFDEEQHVKINRSGKTGR